MSDVIATDQMPVLPAIVETHIKRASQMLGHELVTLGGQSNLDLYAVFDILADCDHHLTDWFHVWEKASDAVHDAVKNAHRSDVWEAEVAAAEAVSAAAVGIYLRDNLPVDSYRKLIGPWQTVMDMS